MQGRKLDQLYWDLTVNTRGLEKEIANTQRRLRGLDDAGDEVSESFREIGAAGMVATRIIERAFRDAADAGRRAGKDIGEGLADELENAGPDVARASRDMADDILAILNREFREQSADLTRQLASGSISRAEFEQFGRELALDFNLGLRAGMSNLRAVRADFGQRAKLTRAFKTLGGDAADDFETGFRGRLRNFGERFSGFFTRTRAIVATVFAGVAARAGQELFRIGSAAEEVESKFLAVFRGSAKELDEFIDDFGRLAGVTRREGRDFIATTGAIAQGMGFATDESADFSREIFQLAADLASFNNVPVENTLRAINSALTGEREALKQYGIVIRESEVQQRALVESGKSHVTQLTQQERALATLTIAQARAGQANGDLVRTQDSAANRARRLATDLRSIREAVAEAALPALEALVGFMADNTDKVANFVRLMGRVGEELGRRLGFGDSELERQGRRIIENLADPQLVRAQIATLRQARRQAEQELEDFQVGARARAFGRAQDDGTIFDKKKLESEVRTFETLIEVAEARLKTLTNRSAETSTQVIEDFSGIATAAEDVAERLELPERGLIEFAREFGDDSAAGRLRAALRALGVSIPFEELRAFVREAREAADAEQELEENTRRVARTFQTAFGLGAVKELFRATGIVITDDFARAIVEGARRGKEEVGGLKDEQLELVESLELAGRTAAEFLSGIDRGAGAALNSLVSIGTAIDDIIELAEKGASFGAFAGPVGLGVAAVSNLVSLASGLFGEDPETKRQREALRQSMDRLRNSIEALADAQLDIPGRISSAVFQARDRARQRSEATGGFLAGAFEPLFFLQELKKAGLTSADIREIADAFDIDLGDLAASMDGASVDARRLGDEVHALMDAFDRDAIARFFETFEGKIDLLEHRFEILDIEKPTEQVDAFRDELLAFANLPADLAAQISGADLQTPEGRAAFERAIEEAFRRAMSDPEALRALAGGLDPREFLNFLGRIEALLDTAQEGDIAGAGDTIPLEVRKAITEVSANRLIATQDTAIIQRNKIIQLLETGLFGGSAPAFTIHPPDNSRLAPGTPAMSVSVGPVQTGDVNVTAPASASPDEVARLVVSRQARDLAAAIEPEISRLQGERLRRDVDASGRTSH